MHFICELGEEQLWRRSGHENQHNFKPWDGFGQSNFKKYYNFKKYETRGSGNHMHIPLRQASLGQLEDNCFNWKWKHRTLLTSGPLKSMELRTCVENWEVRRRKIWFLFKHILRLKKEFQQIYVFISPYILLIIVHVIIDMIFILHFNCLKYTFLFYWS